MLRRVLVANRGEIAVRTIRACRELGVATVALRCGLDQPDLISRLADGSVMLEHEAEAGPVGAYLDKAQIVAAAISSGCDAIHPGYGFLSENADFARMVLEAGLVWVGPPPEAIEAMGDKVRARETAQAAGVPVVPGLHIAAGAEHDAAGLARAVEQLGLPLLVKASAGGGGKGMRLVTDAGELAGSIEAARREAQGAFGNPGVYLERCIERPRHIEIQLLADAHGRIVHLGERECSIQRRHQKVVEETPSAAVSPELRAEMGAAAVALARQVGYAGAGTVEFIMAPDGRWYFLEMNTRLQVEHPITEETYGVDIVQWQLRIAAGEPLTLQQEALQPRGHSIEARICAEDAEGGFLPQVGTVGVCNEPSGPGIRLDGSLFLGAQVSPHFDPLLAKLIVHAETREAAVRRMLCALEQTRILGVVTNLPFLHALIAHPAFAAGETHTGFIAQHFAGWKQSEPTDAEWIAAALARELHKRPSAASSNESAGEATASPWLELAGWSNT